VGEAAMHALENTNLPLGFRVSLRNLSALQSLPNSLVNEVVLANPNLRSQGFDAMDLVVLMLNLPKKCITEKGLELIKGKTAIGKIAPSMYKSIMDIVEKRNMCGLGLTANKLNPYITDSCYMALYLLRRKVDGTTGVECDHDSALKLLYKYNRSVDKVSEKLYKSVLFWINAAKQRLGEFRRRREPRKHRGAERYDRVDQLLERRRK